MKTSLLLEMSAGAFPERVAFGSLESGVCYEDLVAQARAGAVLLSEHAAETVVFLGLNSMVLPSVIFASALIGRPFAPLNYRLSDEELARLVARTAPSVAVVDDDMLKRVEGIEGVVVIARSQFEAACRDATYRSAPCQDIEADIAILLFTSGTTGEPKAAVLRHRHLASYVTSTVEFGGAGEDEAALVSVPPYHIAGISAVLTGVYGTRRTVHLSAFTPEDWVAAATTHKITHAMVVPTMLGRILDLLEKNGETLPHLRSLSYGGGRMPQPVIERALTMLPHVNFVNAYGLTETSSTVAVLGPDDHREAVASSDPKVRRRLGSVGRPLPTLELEIRGHDGSVLGPGQHGEVYVRGEQVAGEYLHKKVIGEDGWFATNDEGWLDEDGYLYIEGRLDDVIVRGGENMSPGEIEDVLRTHPQVADVAVFGVPDVQWGEKVAAVVVPRGSAPTSDELATWTRARLRSSKTPEVWAFREALPYNETGKLLRRVLKAEFSKAPELAAS